ncbi:MAG: hypothetical protein KIS91_05590 [Anaerolineae bacterium]|nr:hypothetical protein [Anaerolineae bacterium]
MSGLFPVLTYKPTYAEVDIPCLADPGREIFRRVGKTNSLRQVVTFNHAGREYVAKTYSRNLGEIAWHDMRKAKGSFDEAARYLPVAPTLFAYGRERADGQDGERTVIRLQAYYRRRLCDLSDDELRSPAIKPQLLALLDAIEAMIREAGWLPDPFGHPPPPTSPLAVSCAAPPTSWSATRRHVAFIDINYPQPWNMTGQPPSVGALNNRLRLDRCVFTPRRPMTHGEGQPRGSTLSVLRRLWSTPDF